MLEFNYKFMFFPLFIQWRIYTFFVISKNIYENNVLPLQHSSLTECIKLKITEMCTMPIRGQ